MDMCGIELQTAPLDELMAQAAEILETEVRQQLTQNKFSSEDWMTIIRAAERAGLTPVLMPLASLSFDLDHSSCLNRAMTIDPEIKAVCQ